MEMKKDRVSGPYDGEGYIAVLSALKSSFNRRKNPVLFVVVRAGRCQHQIAVPFAYNLVGLARVVCVEPVAFFYAHHGL